MAVAPGSFAEQMTWLARRRLVVDLAPGVGLLDGAGRLPRGMAAVTFDDGFASVYEHALPILARLHLPATVFLVAETLTDSGRPVDWVDDPPAGRRLRALTPDRVLEMAEAGVRFGSHGHSHRDLTDLTDAECERELRESRDVLEALLEAPVPFLAYPRGQHDERVRQLAARAGYTNAFTLPEGPEPTGPFSIGRVGIYRADGPARFRIKVARWFLAVRLSPFLRARRRLAAPRRAGGSRP